MRKRWFPFLYFSTKLVNENLKNLKEWDSDFFRILWHKGMAKVGHLARIWGILGSSWKEVQRKIILSSKICGTLRFCVCSEHLMCLTQNSERGWTSIRYFSHRFAWLPNYFTSKKDFCFWIVSWNISDIFLFWCFFSTDVSKCLLVNACGECARARKRVSRLNDSRGQRVRVLSSREWVSWLSLEANSAGYARFLFKFRSVLKVVRFRV